ARRIKKLVHEILPEAEVIGQIDSVEGAIQWFKEDGDADFALMDIQLADGPCFDIFEFADVKIPVIFTTAYDQYAFQAFKVSAIDYLLKPIKRDDLEKAVEKYTNFTKGQAANTDYKEIKKLLQPDKPRRFMVKLGTQIRLISMDEVAYFYTENKITYLITWKGKRHPIDHTLEKIEEMVDPTSFFRINRQFIIHIDAIQGMQVYSKSRFKVDLDPDCSLDAIVSAERSPRFRKWVSGL
ncbi:MAG: LytTR family DNA-binding domain-containing protein, partial [Bacteroidota bacterium]